jgi:hypothetical protein
MTSVVLCGHLCVILFSIAQENLIFLGAGVLLSLTYKRMALMTRVVVG